MKLSVKKPTGQKLLLYSCFFAVVALNVMPRAAAATGFHSGLFLAIRDDHSDAFNEDDLDREEALDISVQDFKGDSIRMSNIPSSSNYLRYTAKAAVGRVLDASETEIEDWEIDFDFDAFDLMQNETEAPVTEPPTAEPSPEEPTSAPTSSGSGINEKIWGIVGFSLLGFVVLVAFFGFYTSRSRGNTSDQDKDGAPLMVGQRQGGYASRRMSGMTQLRESMSTIFSRERVSTWSGRYSGKIEALPGKDEALAMYTRDARHEKNLKRKKREKRNNESGTGIARKGTLTSTYSINNNAPRSKRHQTAASNWENSSLREVEKGDDPAITDQDSEI